MTRHPRPVRRLAAALGVLLAVVLPGCTGAPAAPATSPPVSATPTAPTASPRPAPMPRTWRPAGEPSAVAAGLDAPWSVVPLGDGTQLLSLRDAGDVIEVDPAGVARVVGTVPGVVAYGEGGLHGIALPRAGVGAWLYAYLGTAEDNRVVRMELRGSAGQRTLGEPQTVVAGIPRASTHNGGRIAFGPEGLLYVATGDATERDTAQDPASLGGKILRLTPEGAPAPGNPFGNAVYSLGHRNVQGLAWTADGTMWASEFGQDTFDEVNRIVPGGNYGWPVHEGVSGDPAFVDPILTWRPDEASPSGLAAAGRTLFVAGLRGERAWMLDVDGVALAAGPEPLWAGVLGRVRDVVADGEALWLLTNETDGRGDPGPDDDRLLRVPLAPGG